MALYAWDQTSGQYGTVTISSRGGQPFFTASATASITVDDAMTNQRLLLIRFFAAIDEGQTTSGITLSTELTSLIGDVDTDTNFNSLGIAVVGMSEDEAGSWEYSTDGGASWNDFSALTSSLSETTAFLIDASDTQAQIRFDSNTDNGESATLNFFAWDQSSGTAGTQVDITATYTDTDSAYSRSDSGDSINGANQFTLTINDLNDAPQLGTATTNLGTITEDDADSSESDVTTFDLSSELSSLITDVIPNKF